MWRSRGTFPRPLRSKPIASLSRLQLHTNAHHPPSPPPHQIKFVRPGTENSNGEPALNLLSFDDGGVTGLCSLLTLKEIMNRLQAKGYPSKKANPWQHFDLIAGTGTGALCAIMLGRLRMSVDDAIAEYMHIMSHVFSDKKLLVRGSSADSKTSKLEQGLKYIVKKATGNAEERMLEEAGEAKCKAVVYAMFARNMGAGGLCSFRTYPVRANETPNCSIWEALRASMARLEHFKSIEIQDQGINHRYVGGGMGCSNPTSQMIKEAATLYPNRLVASVVSIGTGQANPGQLPDRRRSEYLPSIGRPNTTQMLEVTHEIVSDNERVAEEMAARFSSLNGIYYRVNVEQGMQSIERGEWERKDEIAAHTRAYMQMQGTNRLVDNLVSAVHERLGVTKTNHIDGRAIPLSGVPTTASSYARPPTWMFTGRTTEIELVKKYFENEKQDQQLFVLHGLDGAGKTETALKSVQSMESRQVWKVNELSLRMTKITLRFEGVIFINGSSRENIEASLSEFAAKKRLGNTHKDALRWLEGCKARWLMLFDNVDNPEVRVHEYFPRGAYSILITTRHNEIVRLAQGEGARCRVGALDPTDAGILLMRSAGLYTDQLPDSERAAAAALLQEFGHLALAIVLCGAYISQKGCSISQYYEKYLVERREILQGDGPVLTSEGSKLCLHTTWEMSYKTLGDAPKRLLGLIAFMYRNHISEEIFQRANANVTGPQLGIPPTPAEADAEREVKEILGLFVNKTGVWSSWLFQSTMGDLVCLSLITFDASDNVYRLHPLVQRWARAIVPDTQAAVERASLLLALAINREEDSQNVAFRCSIVPHVNEVIRLNPTPSPNDSWQFIQAYSEVAQLDQAEKLEAQVLNASKAHFGPEDFKTLEVMTFVAETHAQKGRLKEAEQLKSLIIDCQKRLEDDHPDKLKSLASLATTMHMQGRLTEAEELKLMVLAARSRALGDDHADTLWSRASLAVTYHDQDRLEKAESLYLEVIDAEKRLFGDNHPATLRSMADLAAIYHTQRRFTEAATLKSEVHSSRERVLGGDHPDTWQSMTDLAATYYEQGQFADAESLNLKALAAQKQTLGADQPRTLQTMAELAATYHMQGRLTEAEELKVKVLSARRRVLGDEHADTLWSLASLAVTRHHQGRLEEAESGFLEALAAQKRVLGEWHPDTLQVVRDLASTYRAQGRQGDAEELEALSQVKETTDEEQQ